MVDLELSWRAAAVTAACLGGAAVGCHRARRPRVRAAAGFLRESAVLLALFALWQLAGSYAVMGPDGAIDRAQWIWHAERAVHLPSEAGVQQAFLSHPLVVQAMNLYYAGLHFAVVITCLLWVYIWHRRQYPRVRTTLVLFTAGALLIQLVPVAPPRKPASCPRCPRYMSAGRCWWRWWWCTCRGAGGGGSRSATQPSRCSRWW